MRIEEVWAGRGAGHALLRILFAPLSGLYWLGWQAYLAVYRLKLKRAKEPHCPVICIGNLTVGGSGKTPVTIHVAKLLRELGQEVVISASGYGSKAAEGANLARTAVTNQPAPSLPAQEWGDEPAMIRWLLPDVPLIVGRDRVRAAEICHQHFPDAILLLDDGLQHLPLKKHLQICLDDPSATNRMVLPAGPYREPRTSLGRMDRVIDDLRFQPTGFLLNGTEPAEQPTSANALCAIARPERFFDTLSGQGIEIAAAKSLPDHDPLTAGTLFEGLPPGLPLIVTAKDWVKLRDRCDIGSRQILVAMQEARIEPEDEFKAWLRSKLDEISKA